MKIHKFSGTHYEIGRQFGKLYKTNKHKFSSNPVSTKQLNIYKKFYPEILEELTGIADEMNIDKKLVINDHISSIIKPKNACSIFSYNNLVGRNYDWANEAKKISHVCLIQPTNFNSYISISDGGYWKGQASINTQLFIPEATNSEEYRIIRNLLHDKGIDVHLKYDNI